MNTLRVCFVPSVTRAYSVDNNGPRGTPCSISSSFLLGDVRCNLPLIHAVVLKPVIRFKKRTSRSFSHLLGRDRDNWFLHLLTRFMKEEIMQKLVLVVLFAFFPTPNGF